VRAYEGVVEELLLVEVGGDVVSAELIEKN